MHVFNTHTHMPTYTHTFYLKPKHYLKPEISLSNIVFHEKKKKNYSSVDTALKFKSIQLICMRTAKK